MNDKNVKIYCEKCGSTNVIVTKDIDSAECTMEEIAQRGGVNAIAISNTPLKYQKYIIRCIKCGNGHEFEGL